MKRLAFPLVVITLVAIGVGVVEAADSLNISLCPLPFDGWITTDLTSPSVIVVAPDQVNNLFRIEEWDISVPQNPRLVGSLNHVGIPGVYQYLSTIQRLGTEIVMTLTRRWIEYAGRNPVNFARLSLFQISMEHGVKEVQNEYYENNEYPPPPFGGIEIDDRFIYLQGLRGLKVFERTSDTSATLVDEVRADSPHYMTVINSKLITTDYGYKVYDLATLPDSLFKLSEFEGPWSPGGDLTTSDGYLFGISDGIRICSLNDSNSLDSVGFVSLPDTLKNWDILSFCIAGKCLVLSCMYPFHYDISGLLAFDIREITSPRLAGYYFGNSAGRVVATSNEDVIFKSVTGTYFIDMQSILDVDEIKIVIPTEYSISVYPNPFNGAVTIGFASLPASGGFLRIYDQSGRNWSRTMLDGQTGKWVWDAAGAPAGSYFIELQSSGETVVKPVTLLK